MHNSRPYQYQLERYTGNKEVIDVVKNLTGQLCPQNTGASSDCVSEFAPRLIEEFNFLSKYDQIFF